MLTFDLASTEINTIVEGAYKRHPHQFNTFQIQRINKKINKESNEMPAPVENVPIDKSPLTDLLTMPCIPDTVFPNLPEIISKGAYVFNSCREKDIFLTGALTTLSGCLPNVEGIYDQRTVYPNLNLNCFIISSAASGKSALVWSKALGQAYHNKLLKESREALKHYPIPCWSCENIDFETDLSLADVFLQHAVYMFRKDAIEAEKVFI